MGKYRDLFLHLTLRYKLCLYIGNQQGPKFHQIFTRVYEPHIDQIR